MDSDVVNAWLATADRNVRAVRILVSAPEPVVEPAAFHCQQAAEKLVKTLLVAAGIHPPKSHDIARLTALLPPDHPLRPLVEPFERLTITISEHRYPGGNPLDAGIDEPTVAEVASWLAEIEAARGAVVRHLGL